ncbi:MAG: zinc-ribbon domain-containing protein [Erysipelotrichaceae bacterium]|nr:zinc-ribbon domain-containing protein [Erysipelotrichaceae bacterium]
MDDKAIKQCPACGASIQGNSKFCPSCGMKLSEHETVPAEEKETVLICPDCGAVLEEGSLFCTNCGCRISAEEDHADLIPDNLMRCPHCNNLIEKGSNFCPYCSAQLSEKKGFILTSKTLKIIKTAGLVILGIVLCLAIYKIAFEKTVIYNRALKLMDQEQYEEAYDLFVKLDDYKDSQQQSQECMTHIQDSIYQRAIALRTEGKFEEALDNFKKIRGYSDADTQTLISELMIANYITNYMRDNDNLFITNRTSSDWEIACEEWNKPAKGKYNNLHFTATNDFCTIDAVIDATYSYLNESDFMGDFHVDSINYISVNLQLTGFLPDDKKAALLNAIQQQNFAGTNISSNRYITSSYYNASPDSICIDYVLSISEQGKKYNDVAVYETLSSYNFKTGEWSSINHNKIRDDVVIENIHNVNVFVRDIPNKSGKDIGMLNVGDYTVVTEVLEDASKEYGDSEYRWYKVVTGNGKEAWVAERKSQTWYEFFAY